jgi:hypothetical protein
MKGRKVNYVLLGVSVSERGRVHGGVKEDKYD